MRLQPDGGTSGSEVPVIKSSELVKRESAQLGNGSIKCAWLCEWHGKRVVKLEFLDVVRERF